MSIIRLAVAEEDGVLANPDPVCFLFALTSFLCPREESNLHRKFRKLEFYPLNYEDLLCRCKTILLEHA